MENQEYRQRKQKKMGILDSILEAVQGENAYEGLEMVASPVSFFLIGMADMAGKDRLQIMESFFTMVRAAARYPGETID